MQGSCDQVKLYMSQHGHTLHYGKYYQQQQKSNNKNQVFPSLQSPASGKVMEISIYMCVCVMNQEQTCHISQLVHSSQAKPPPFWILAKGSSSNRFSPFQASYTAQDTPFLLECTGN